MGLEEKEERNLIFVGTYGGYFTTRTTKEDTAENVTTRELTKGPNTGTRIYERQFGKLSGRLEDIYTEESDFGKRWVFIIQDGEDQFKLSFPYNSNNANQVIFRLPNTDLLEPIELLIFFEKEHINDKGKNIPGRNVIWAKQDGMKIPMKKWEDWNELPDLEIITVNGEDKWDSTKRNAYLEDEYIGKQIKPMIDSLGAAEKEAEVPAYQSDQLDQVKPVEPEQPPLPTDKDELPF